MEGGGVTLENKAYFILGNSPLTRKKYSNFAANQRISETKLFELVKKKEKQHIEKTKHALCVHLCTFHYFIHTNFNRVVFETINKAQKEKIRRGSGQVLF